MSIVAASMCDIAVGVDHATTTAQGVIAPNFIVPQPHCIVKTINDQHVPYVPLLIGHGRGVINLAAPALHGRLVVLVVVGAVQGDPARRQLVH